MDKDTALRIALEALEEPKEHIAKHRRLEAITAIKEVLAQPKQELVCICGAVWDGQRLVLTPPQRKPLPPKSPCEMTQAEEKMFKLGWLECEAAHGIKGE